MRNKIILVLLSFSCILIAQEPPVILDSYARKNFKYNELKVNVFSTTFGYPEISYERLLTSKSSVGITGIFYLSDYANYDSDFLNGAVKLAIIPHIRFYRGRKPAAGWFVEGGLIFFREEVYDTSVSIFDKKKENGLAPTIVGGGKFIFKNGFFWDIYLGTGWNLINRTSTIKQFPRFGISIGYRF